MNWLDIRKHVNFKMRKEDGGWKYGVTWAVELLGTFLMVFMILAPATFNFTSGAYGPVVANLWSTFAFRSFYVAFFIWVLVMIFRRVSANFNPAVTLVHMARKDDTFWLGTGKIVVQFAGAFAAAFAAHGFAEMAGTWSSTNSLDALTPTLQIYDWWGTGSITPVVEISGFNIDNQMNWWWIVVVAIEAVLTYLLLASVFMGGKYVTYAGRPFVIFGMLFIIIALGGRTHNVALNPARLVAPAVVGQMYGGAQGTLDATWMFLTGEFIAVAIMIWIQLNPRTKEKVVKAPQTQKGYAKYIGWFKMRTKLQASGNVVIDWSSYTVKELKEIAKDLEVENYNKMKRDELIKKLSSMKVEAPQR